jgi:hypothetical protein
MHGAAFQWLPLGGRSDCKPSMIGAHSSDSRLLARCVCLPPSGHSTQCCDRTLSILPCTCLPRGRAARWQHPIGVVDSIIVPLKHLGQHILPARTVPVVSNPCRLTIRTTLQHSNFGVLTPVELKDSAQKEGPHMSVQALFMFNRVHPSLPVHHPLSRCSVRTVQHILHYGSEVMKRAMPHSHTCSYR